MPRRESAASTATFALLAPVLFLVLFGAMEGGRVLFAWNVITNEAREAARYGAVNYGRTDVDLQALVEARLDNRLRSVLPAANITPPPSVVIQPDPARHVDVTVYYRVPLVIPLVRQVLPNPFPLRATSEMRGE